MARGTRRAEGPCGLTDSSDAATVRQLRAAMQRSLTQDNRTAARRALFQAMAVMGWQYRQEPPRVRSTSICPRGEWTRKD